MEKTTGHSREISLHKISLNFIFLIIKINLKDIIYIDLVLVYRLN